MPTTTPLARDCAPSLRIYRVCVSCGCWYCVLRNCASLLQIAYVLTGSDGMHLLCALPCLLIFTTPFFLARLPRSLCPRGVFCVCLSPPVPVPIIGFQAPKRGGGVTARRRTVRAPEVLVGHVVSRVIGGEGATTMMVAPGGPHTAPLLIGIDRPPRRRTPRIRPPPALPDSFLAGHATVRSSDQLRRALRARIFGGACLLRSPSLVGFLAPSPAALL